MHENGNVELSLPTLRLLRDVMARQQLSVGDPTFRETALAVVAAIDELDAAIAAHSEIVQ